MTPKHDSEASFAMKQIQLNIHSSIPESINKYSNLNFAVLRSWSQHLGILAERDTQNRFVVHHKRILHHSRFISKISTFEVPNWKRQASTNYGKGKKHSKTYHCLILQVLFQLSSQIVPNLQEINKKPTDMRTTKIARSTSSPLTLQNANWAILTFEKTQLNLAIQSSSKQAWLNTEADLHEPPSDPDSQLQSNKNQILLLNFRQHPDKIILLEEEAHREDLHGGDNMMLRVSKGTNLDKAIHRRGNQKLSIGGKPCALWMTLLSKLHHFANFP